MTAPAQQMASFADPAAVGGTRPAIRDLVGRTVVIRPTRYEPNAPAIKAGETQQRITADILIVDGGPLEFGGNMVTKKVPNTLRVAAPYWATGVLISNKNVVDAVKDQVGIAPVLGRIEEGKASDPTFNNPYNLIPIASTEPQYSMAAQLYTQVLNNTFVNPTPASIGAAPAQTFATQATYVPPAPTPVVDPQVAFLAWQAANAAPATPAQSEIPAAPAGWDDDVWRGLAPEQRNEVLTKTAENRPF